MRRLFTVLACATLVVGLGAPAWGNGSGSSSTDQPITAMGKGGHRGGHHGDRGDRGYRRGGRGHHHDGYGRGYRRGDRHGYHRDRYGYGYGRGYYGCGYYPDCDPYYGGYYGGRRYYYDRYDSCGRGPRYDYRCDCYHRDTRCDRYNGYRGRGSRGYYGPYSVDGQENTSPVADAPIADAPAAESPSPQQQSEVVAVQPQDHPAPAPDEPSGETAEPTPAPEPAHEAAPAPSSEPAPEPAAEEEKGSPDKTVNPASTNPDPKAEPGTGKARYDRESSDSGEELF